MPMHLELARRIESEVYHRLHGAADIHTGYLKMSTIYIGTQQSTTVYSSRASVFPRDSTVDTTQAASPKTKHNKPTWPSSLGTRRFLIRFRAALSSRSFVGTIIPISVVPSSGESTTSTPHRGMTESIALCNATILHVMDVLTRTMVSFSCVKVALASSAPGSMILHLSSTEATIVEVIRGVLGWTPGTSTGLGQ